MQIRLIEYTQYVEFSRKSRRKRLIAIIIAFLLLTFLL